MKNKKALQKVIGFMMIAISILLAIVTGGDITFPVFFIPIGVYAIFTREYLLSI